VLYAADTAVVGLGGTIDEAVDALAGAGCVLAPRALTLTMFQRLFVADLFVHGTGGGRYDRVTDAVISAYYGVEPPAFVVASLTLLLPLNAPLVTDEDVRALEARMHRLVHNPDEAIAEVAFETDAQRTRAEALVSQKAALVAAIAAPDADRKAVGASIRAVNEALLELLGLATDELRDAVERTRVERDASAVLADRTYPYCLWDPREVMEAVR
jgi:hypothetical protein